MKTFFLKNNTSGMRYVQLEEVTLSFGPEGSYNQFVEVAEGYLKHPVVRQMLNQGILSKVDVTQYAEEQKAVEIKSLEETKAEEAAVLAAMNNPQNHIVTKTCTECGKEFGIDSVGPDITICNNCTEEAELKAKAEAAEAKAQEEAAAKIAAERAKKAEAKAKRDAKKAEKAKAEKAKAEEAKAEKAE